MQIAPASISRRPFGAAGVAFVDGDLSEVEAAVPKDAASGDRYPENGASRQRAPDCLSTL